MATAISVIPFTVLAEIGIYVLRYIYRYNEKIRSVKNASKTLRSQLFLFFDLRLLQTTSEEGHNQGSTTGLYLRGQWITT